jgi:maltooligosyltrehalose trehalohydrolase
MAELGATATDEGVDFSVWAPSAGSVTIRVRGAEQPLVPDADGVWAAEVAARPGDDYLFVLDGVAWPDPASRWQPSGVRGPSRVMERPSVQAGPGLDLRDLVTYELHVGTFTDEGTFVAAIPLLGELRRVGFTAIELMPFGTFPGSRNWGYDGLYISAPHAVYGGPAGLSQLVDAAHAEGLAVIADVVYNHIGPGSEAVAAFGPYFTDRHDTFWGAALNYSERGVREWAIQNAELWVRDYRVDGLRLDAVHAIYDDESPIHVLRELRDRVKAINSAVLVISEQGTEDFRPLEEWGHDAMWLDSLHHHLHVLLTGERDGYYASFGSIEGLVRELTRDKPERLVVAAQNHDQIGNRATGDRLTPELHRFALAVVLFSPLTPLIFMGEEYEEQRPFQFFTDHIDPEIARATTEGRRREFDRFAAFAAEVPDPQDIRTFAASKLAHKPADPLIRRLLELRRTLPRELRVETDGERLILRRGDTTLVADFATTTVELS